MAKRTSVFGKGIYELASMRFEFYSVILGFGITIEFLLFQFSLESYVDELLAILISGGIYFFVRRKEKIDEKEEAREYS